MQGLSNQVKQRLKRNGLLVKSWRWASQQMRRARQALRKPQPTRFFDTHLVAGTPPSSAKRGLVSYVVPPLPLTPEDPQFFLDRSIYTWHTYVIAQILNRLGYIVDLIQWDDVTFTPEHNYDLYVAHGGVISEKIMAALPPDSVRIYWASIMYWKYYNEEEMKRLAAIQARRGVMLPADRYVHHSEDGALTMAHGIIGLGNRFIEETYGDFSRVTMVNNMARPVDDFDTEDKDFLASRDHFLYFAGAGAVQKGLDLLLEAFAKLERQHLWIAAPVEPQFKELYQEELTQRPNIHYVGVIRPRWSEFVALMERCCYVISASSGEGQPHSVVECMAYGLIPIVSIPCGIDVEDFGLLIDPCTSDHIADLVTTLSDYDPERCRFLSARTREVVTQKYSEAAFTQQVTAAINAILATTNTPLIELAGTVN